MDTNVKELEHRTWGSDSICEMVRELGMVKTHIITNMRVKKLHTETNIQIN